ncbi:MAG: hypothetical protein R2771_15790 [Saprospiraceae bacterium]
MTGCDFDSEEVVWYEITAPSDANPGSNLNIQFLSYDGDGDLFVAAFENDCPPMLLVVVRQD